MALDRLLLLAAKRRSLGVAIRCGMVGLLAALALALILAGGLLVRRESRPYGWAVLMGSTQGSVGSFVVLVATLAAAIGPD